MTSLTKHPEWQALQKHYEQIQSVHLRDLFADDPDRAAFELSWRFPREIDSRERKEQCVFP